MSLLDPVKNSTIPNQSQFPPPQAIGEEQEEWGVSQVEKSKLKIHKLWYLVEWKESSEEPEITTWVTSPNLTNSQYLSRIFIFGTWKCLAQIPQEFDFLMLGGE
ncbi:hypothetical protein O181_065738 [Austropuccinia psidii MF-1]|uniref:Chromo domain-containing protein n=1 Tax=Austropuccinia psidii MF-1 TaxID=1389203 RepID=A0A9Q3EQ60_9BASI|nr:hypothetical protein [Austropuccinia psidii MF-1]